MNNIFGIGLLQGHTLKSDAKVRTVVKKLFHGLLAPGYDSSGIATTTLGTIAILQSALAANFLTDTEEYKQLMTQHLCTESVLNTYKKTMAIMAQCGKNENNITSPVVARHVVGVVDGTIDNGQAVGELYGLPSEYRNNNPTNIFAIINALQSFSHDVSKTLIDPIMDMSLSLTGSYAYAFVHDSIPNQLYLVRNGSPLSVRAFPSVGLVVYSTLLSVIHSATVGLGLGDSHELPLEDGTGMCLDLYNNTLARFVVDREKEAKMFFLDEQGED